MLRISFVLFPMTNALALTYMHRCAGKPARTRSDLIYFCDRNRSRVSANCCIMATRSSQRCARL
jgi:hypothetical protein